MERRTQQRRDVVRLQASLPPVSMAQANWIVGQDKERARKEYAELKRKRIVTHWDCYTIVTAHEGWQVTRHIFIHSTYTEKRKEHYYLDFLTEVNQGWMRCDENGRLQIEIFQRKKRPFWYGSNQPYVLSSPMVLKPLKCDYTRGGCDMFGAYDETIYPIRRYAPSIVANGLDKFVGRADDLVLYECLNGYNTYDMDYLHKDYAMAVSRPTQMRLTEKCYLPTKVETLYKTGDTAVASLLLGHSYCASQVSTTYWRPYLIARKNGLRLRNEDDCQMWADYLGMLTQFGKDIHNAHYTAPRNLRKEHDRLVEKIQAKRRLEEQLRKRKEQYEEEHAEEVYAERMGKYLGLCFADRDIEIRPLQSIKEFVEEGDAMHHCVYANGYYKSEKNCIILSAKDRNGKRVETIEVGLGDFTIHQSRGACNQTTPYHDRIISLVDRNMGQIRNIANNRVAFS